MEGTGCLTVRDFFSRSGDDSPSGDFVPVMVDCSLTFAEMVAAGNYDSVDRCVTPDNFSAVNSWKREVGLTLEPLGRVAVVGEVFDRLIRRPLITPAGPEEILAFGAKFPEIQRCFPVIAFGAAPLIQDKWFNCQASLLLSGNESWRMLEVAWFTAVLPKNCLLLLSSL